LLSVYSPSFRHPAEFLMSIQPRCNINKSRSMQRITLLAVEDLVYIITELQN
jgi:hypothetical protein